MDSSGGSEKSLPGMGMPRWMKKTTERYNYSDVCASPPSNEDGFLHISRHRLPASATNSEGQNVGCSQNQKKNSAFNGPQDMVPSSSQAQAHFQPEGIHFGQGSPIILAKHECAGSKETSNFYKTVATTAAPSSTFVSLAVRSQQTMNPSEISSGITDTTVYGKSKVSISQDYVKIPAKKSEAALNSAILPEDTKPTIFVSKSKSRDEEMDGRGCGGQQLITKINGILTFQPDDTTPSSTPSQTPTCSPQVARRSGNPFFTGSQDKTNSGNWLFRSSSPGPSYNKSDKIDEFRNNSYEARGDIGRPSSAGPGVTSSASSQKVRLVPRPSELRELNFWSPTSM